MEFETTHIRKKIILYLMFFFFVCGWWRKTSNLELYFCIVFRYKCFCKSFYFRCTYKVRSDIFNLWSDKSTIRSDIEFFPSDRMSSVFFVCSDIVRCPTVKGLISVRWRFVICNYWFLLDKNQIYKQNK